MSLLGVDKSGLTCLRPCRQKFWYLSLWMYVVMDPRGIASETHVGTWFDGMSISAPWVKITSSKLIRGIGLIVSCMYLMPRVCQWLRQRAQAWTHIHQHAVCAERLHLLLSIIALGYGNLDLSHGLSRSYSAWIYSTFKDKISIR